MPKSIDQLIDDKGHLVEFIYPCARGYTLVRWFEQAITMHLLRQQLLPRDKADWVKNGLIKYGYHYT